VRTCPNCGATVADADEFCGNCGTYLAWLKGGDGDSGPRPAGRPAAVTPAEPAAETPAEPTPEQPHAVAPARPVAQRRPRTATPATESVQTGPTCPVCGTVNPQGARFCRHCGASLVETAVPKPASRRLTWPRWLRFRGTGGSPWPRRVVLLLILAALVVAGFLLYPLGVNLVQDTRDKLATPTKISPSTETATAATSGHPVDAAVDGLNPPYWGVPAVGNSAQFTFAQPFRLLGVIITPGASTDQAAFNQEARPTAVDLVITTVSGTTTTIPVTLADKPGPQTTNTGISDVTGVRVVVRTATPVAPGRSVALAEIEFFKRS